MKLNEERNLTGQTLESPTTLDGLIANHGHASTQGEMSSAEGKSLQFVVYDEKKIYTLRKYVRRNKVSNPRQNGNQNVKSSCKKSDDRLTANECPAKLSNYFYDLGHTAQLDTYGDTPVVLSPVASQALTHIARFGPRCQLTKAWFTRALLDRNLIHCFIFYSVSFPWVLRTPEEILGNHPSVLAWKVRAIQATNELLRDDTRNTSDYALVAIAILSAMERMSGNVPDMVKHSRGLELIMQQRRLDGDFDSICPAAKRAAEASISTARCIAKYANNVLPYEYLLATACQTEQLRHRLKGSLFCLTRFAGEVECASSKTLFGTMQRLDQMLTACREEAEPGAAKQRSRFSECVDILDDLQVSRGRFLRPLGLDFDPLIPAVARAAWVGAMGSVIWIFMLGLQRYPDDLDTIKLQMLEWINHPLVADIETYPLRVVREWGEYACKLLALKS